MNQTALSEQTLLSQLASLADCGRAEGFACITARHEHGAQSVEIPRPQLTILLHGRKQVSTATQSLELSSGDLLLVTRRCRIDVINLPDRKSGIYLSVLIPLCDQAIAAARLLWNEPLPAPGEELARLPAIALGDILLRWRLALEQGHAAEARLAVTALVVALCRRGYGSLLLPPAPSIAAQVRQLIASQPQHAWRSHEVENNLRLSGATLRRHLSAEQTSLREVITDARLAHAMELLYTTRWPLKTVAARAGYRSTRTFTQRFRQRYGLDPASIGNSDA